MKTNKEMFREYQLNGITVIQRTKDAYFDLNALIHEYNNQRGTKYLLKDFFVLPTIKRAMNTIYRKEVIEKDFSYNLLEINDVEKISPSTNEGDTLKEKICTNGNISKLQNSTLKEKISTNDNISELAEKYVIKRSKGKRIGFGGKREIDKVFCHPHLFVKCCMWLDEDFDYEATKIVYDNLIQLRIEVGDNTNPYNKWIEETFGKSQHNISNIRQGLNKAVFGYHDTVINQRDYATIKELEQYKYYERLIQDFVRAGFFTKVRDITQYLIKEQKKNFPTKPIEN